MTKRELLSLYLAGGATALLAAGCTQQQVADTSAKVAAIITQVQAGVKAACIAAGTVIPTASSVLAVLAAIVPNGQVALATLAMITQAISQIVAVGCPATPPSPSATTASGVRIEFY